MPSPSNTYAYQFPFDWQKFEGFNSNYQFAWAKYDKDGFLIAQQDLSSALSGHLYTAQLGPCDSIAWVFIQP